MINKINTTLDIALKALSLLFTVCVFIGTAVTWAYLNKIGLGNKIPSVLSSPPILLSIALFSISVSVGMISIVLFVPAIIGFCDRNPVFNWAKTSNKNRAILHIILIIVPLILYVISAWLDAIGNGNLILLLSLCLLMTSVFYKIYGGPLNTNISNKLQNFGIVYISLVVVYCLLIINLVFLLKATDYLQQDKNLQWIFLFIIFIIYSTTVAIASSSRNYFSYVPVVAFSLVLIIILFADTGSRNIVSRLGVGSYKASYAVESKNLAAILDDKSYKIEPTNNEAVLILNDVWVVVALPKKLILSATKDNQSTYTIPTSAVLGEISNAN